MKKTFTILLAIVLLFSTAVLGGCSKSQQSEPDQSTPVQTDSTPVSEPSDPDTAGSLTREDLEHSNPGEYITEKLAAGMEVTCAYLGYVDNQMVMEIFAAGVQEVCDELGVTFVKVHAGGDVSNQINQIENYTTMGVSCIVLIPPDAETIKDSVVKAQDAGITVVSYGVAGAEEYTISTTMDNALQGYLVADLATAWVKQYHPEGNVKAAVLGTYAIEEQKIKTDNVVEGLKESGLIDVVYLDNGVIDGIDGGFNAAETAYTYDPEIRLFCLINNVCTYGAQNFVMSLNDVDYSEYGVIGCGTDSSLDEMLAAAARGEGALRGTVAPVGTTASNIGATVKMALLGEISAPYLYTIPFEFRVMDGFDVSGLVADY